MQHRHVFRSALLLALLVGWWSPLCQAEDAQDFAVEDAILQRYQTGTHPGRQQGADVEGEAVRRRRDAADRLLQEEAGDGAGSLDHDTVGHEAAHANLLETQRRHAQAQAGRVAQKREQERRQESLGRGSLRARRQQQQVVRQPAVGASRKGDIFAERTEQQLAAARERLAARRQELAAVQAQLEAAQRAAAAAGQAREAAQQQAQQQQQGGQAEQLPPDIGGKGGVASRIPLPVIVFMTVAMAAAAGLGALPFFFVRSMSEVATGLATAIACGVMLAASFDLVHDGQPYGGGLVVAGLLLGGAFIRWVQQALAAYEDIEFGSLQGSAARKTLLMVGIMAAHALGEGCAVGVSFCGERGWSQGLLTTLAIGVHNVPEGLAKATVLVGQGVSPRRALMWSVATCLPQPLVAIPSFMFVDAFTVILPVALGFAAGCMVWMVFAELLPDSLERAPAAQVATAATVSAAALEGFRMMFASWEAAGGAGGPGGGAAAASALASTLSRMGPPLLTLLPSVVVSSVGSGLLAGSAVPAPVAWGLAAAAAGASGGGYLVDQLAYRPHVPAVHTVASAAAGVALILLLHRQLLAWAASGGAAARKLLAKGAKDGANGVGHADVEALEYASLYQQHHLHHQVHAAHPLFQQNGQAQPAKPYAPDGGVPAGAANGYSGASSSSLGYAAPYHRGSTAALPGTDGGAYNGLPRPGSALGSSGGATPNGGTATPLRSLRHAALLPPAQLAAAGAGVTALAAGCVATGWHFACSLLLLGEDRAAGILPAAALMLAGPGLAAGALARTLPGPRSPALGAWLGGALAGLVALCAALTAARARESPHPAKLVRSLMYPHGGTDTAEALAGGALCAAAYFLFTAGTAVKAPSARGGLLLGLAVAALLGGVRYMLCSFTPYCLSVQVLLSGS